MARMAPLLAVIVFGRVFQRGGEVIDQSFPGAPIGETLVRVVVGNSLPGAGEQFFFLRRAVGHFIPIAVGVVQVHDQRAHVLFMKSPETLLGRKKNMRKDLTPPGRFIPIPNK
jgi:hypothetical protein